MNTITIPQHPELNQVAQMVSDVMQKARVNHNLSGYYYFVFANNETIIHRTVCDEFYVSCSKIVQDARDSEKNLVVFINFMRNVAIKLS